jgi:hypothetical protein
MMQEPGQGVRGWLAFRTLAADFGAEPDAGVWVPGPDRRDPAALTRMPAAQVARMERMAGVFGVALDAMPVLRAEVALSCAGCRAQDACRAALAADTTPDACGFCPNADRFAAAGPGLITPPVRPSSS